MYKRSNEYIPQMTVRKVSLKQVRHLESTIGHLSSV